MISLQEFKEKGGCDGCYFNCVIEEGRKVCTFHWYDDESGDWKLGKNCDEIEERICD